MLFNALQFGSFTRTNVLTKWKKSAKDRCVWFLMIMNRLSVNCWRKQNTSLYLSRIKFIFVELCECRHQLNSAFVSELYSVPERPYNLRKPSKIIQANINIEMSGLNIFRYEGTRIWNMFLEYIKVTNDVHLSVKNAWFTGSQAQNVIAQLYILILSFSRLLVITVNVSYSYSKRN